VTEREKKMKRINDINLPILKRTKRMKRMKRMKRVIVCYLKFLFEFSLIVQPVTSLFDSFLLFKIKNQNDSVKNEFDDVVDDEIPSPSLHIKLHKFQ
jgi:hypothetical protein